MKKAIALILTAAMGVTALCACSGTEEPEAQQDQAEEETVEETDAEETEADAAFNPAMTPDLQNLFDTGMEGFVGVGYEAVNYMGVPESDPLGHTFLCIATTITADPETYWALVTMDDIGSEVNITDIKIIDYAAASTADVVTFTDSNADLVPGGWQAVTDIAVPDEVQNIDGHMFYEVLATQVVAGLNYSCLCLEDGQWEIVTVYVDLDGNAEVTNIAALNI